ncbi:hypothetical protein C6A86_023650 [Mycobacterium sp. ITM-2016-00316]|uniref:hypothetical protein n=1 Tax=Mycobacterium sp. ITM-2016-00316 TaxID=2099695 RepID=UPI00115902DE|nr:hypothetical protein [Mycobacterium sp. ITM-2016-00316]WNG81155.1 hypothetical protein C6A86_023650 [Mycobacterium sp. ITM-2016-00316]
MQSAAGLIAVLAVLMMSYYFMLGRRVGVGEIFDDQGRRVSSTMFGGSFSAFLEGLVAVLALTELSAAGGNRDGSFAAGAFIGILAGAGIVLRRSWPGQLGIALFYSVLGLAAAVPAVTRLFAATGCDAGSASAVRIVAVLILAVFWIMSMVGGLVVSPLRGLRNVPSGLALFGALEVILLISGPIGIGVSPATIVVVVLTVAVAGGLSGLAPGLFMMLCGLALGSLQFVTVSTGVGVGCESLVSTAPVAVLVGYVLVFWMIAWFISKWALRRAARLGAGS